jgi:uncharacterized membrane protein YuzA (DUF378 family)
MVEFHKVETPVKPDLPPKPPKPKDNPGELGGRAPAAATAPEIKDPAGLVDGTGLSSGKTKAKTPAEEITDIKDKLPADKKQSLKDSATASVMNHPNLVIAGLTALTLAMDAVGKAIESMETPRNITKIEKDPNSSGLLLTFTPAIPILATDLVSISGSSVTQLNGDKQTVDSSPQNNQIVMAITGITGLPVTSSCGTMTVTTSFMGQYGAAAAGLAKSAAGAGKNFLCDAVPFICKINISKTIMYIIAAIGGVLFLLSMFMAFTKKKG